MFLSYNLKIINIILITKLLRNRVQRFFYINLQKRDIFIFQMAWDFTTFKHGRLKIISMSHSEILDSVVHFNF